MATNDTLHTDDLFGAGVPVGPGDHEPTVKDPRYSYFKVVVQGVQNADGGTAVWKEDPMFVNLVGCRGFADGQVNSNAGNQYNDTIYACYKDESGNEIVHAYKASVDPGDSCELDSTKQYGRINVLDGWQYWYRYSDPSMDSSERGHGGNPALRNDGKIKYWCDKNYDFHRDTNEGESEAGADCGINLHYAGTGDSVSTWSEGCQVIWGGKDGDPYQQLMGSCKTHTGKHGKRIPYTLLLGSSLPQPFAKEPKTHETEEPKTPVEPVHGITYVVKEDGETLTSIAEQQGKTVSALLADNPSITDPNAPLSEGDEVFLSHGKGVLDYFIYTVRSGDILSAIADKYGTTYQHLAEINGIPDPDVIEVGQKIRIPRPGASSSSSSGGYTLLFDSGNAGAGV